DHIITISTASLNEQDEQAPLKVTTTTTTAATTAAAGAATAIESVEAQLESASATTTKPGRCRWSAFVSYQSNIADVQHRRGRRLHGLQLPLHPLQLFGWLVLLLFALASYWLLIPAFHAPIQGPLYGLITGLYLVHIVAHLTALLTDPADKELRRVHRNDRIVPEFDRSKHGHVIEHGRCHLCNIKTSTPRTKHCSVCNKCVGKFDHHCKWLNHCIGSRNYVAFLMCVVSAVLATLVIVAAVIGQIVLYYVQPEWLSYYWCEQAAEQSVGSSVPSTDYINLTLSLSNGTLLLMEPEEQQQQLEQQADYMSNNLSVSTLPTLLQNFTALLQTTTEQATTTASNQSLTPQLVAGIGLHETIYLLLLGVLGLLAAITAGLLLHLCFFHIYISFLGLTTYEYIRQHRQNQEAKAKQQQQQQQEQPAQSSKPSTQLYCCAQVPHPNQQHQQQHTQSASQSPSTSRLHCCSNSREFHSSQHSLYFCSLLQQREQQQHAAELTATPTPTSSFHCCSSFAANSLQRRVSAAANVQAALQTLPRAPRSAAYLQYREQCSLCTLQLRSPLRPRSAAGSSSTRTLTSQTATPAKSEQPQQQRWHRKWNCCVSVPDSPNDMPHDLLAALESANAKLNASELPVQFIRSLNGGLTELPLPPAASVAAKTPRSSRLRHMLRLLGRYRRARCRHQHAGMGVAVAAAETPPPIKQNQIRPLQLQAAQCASASPPPPSSSPSHHFGEATPHQLLPTSIIRDDVVTTSYHAHSFSLPPALPPPTRRKMPHASELAELAESLGFVAAARTQQQQSHHNSRQLPQSLYRRQRRKHFLRTRSPTLSPIHESGLSNPTSPQPQLRHSKCGTPDVARSSATLVQNLCGLAGEALRKSASNTSLQSISSNSSSN
ncbi:CG17075, partial [Drosophila busckii]